MLIKGIYVPLITPFNSKTEQVDFEALRNNVQVLSKTGIAGFFPLGSNGEFHSLNDDEAINIIKILSNSVPNEIELMVGASRESAYVTVEWVKKCADIGISAAFVLTPSFFASKMDEESLLRFYSYIVEQSPIPILLYTAPGYACKVEIHEKVVSILSKHRNCIGMKDSSGKLIEEYSKHISDKFSVFAGSQKKFSQWLQSNAIGGVLSAANYVPEYCVKSFDLYNEGKFEEFSKLNDEICNLSESISGKYGVSGVKFAASYCGFNGGVPRNPLIPLFNEQQQEIIRALEVFRERVS